MHIDARAAGSAARGALPRLRLPRTAWWLGYRGRR